ncbi:unnamed protein product, partial [Cyprideis torosa]
MKPLRLQDLLQDHLLTEFRVKDLSQLPSGCQWLKERKKLTLLQEEGILDLCLSKDPETLLTEAFLEIFRRSSHRQHLLKRFLCSGHASGDNRSPFAPADDTELQEFRIAVQEFQNQIVSSDTIMDPKVLDLCLMDPEYLLRSLLHSCLRNGARAVPQTLDVLKEQCQYHEVPSFCRLAVKFVAEFLRQLVSAEMVRPPPIPLTVTSLATLLSQDAGDLIAREELLFAGILPLWKGNPSTSVLRFMQ